MEHFTRRSFLNSSALAASSALSLAAGAVADFATHRASVFVTWPVTSVPGSGDGVLERFVERAIGSLRHPMTDQDLEGKFSGLAAGILSPARTRRIMDLCWKIGELPDAADIARAARAS